MGEVASPPSDTWLRAGVPVRGNRWDTLGDGPPARWPTVAVVVPYFEQQAQLDLTLAALAGQDYPPHLVEVVVADDGSATAPDLPPGVLHRRQPDRGFRAAAARNLGIAATTGEVIAFLDADTVPEPDYLRYAVRLPALAPEALVVGRRRHARLTGPDADPDTPLAEPAWLAHGYRETRDLLDADDRAYRFVLSSVLTCTRLLVEEVGGFDETIVGYGGEDWEFGYRAWRGGALLAHEPRAVAWHDGPDFGGRDDPLVRRRAKNTETLALAERIPVPGSRPPGLRCAGADLTVYLDGAATPAALVATAATVLATTDARIEIDAPVPELLRRDPRVRPRRTGPDAHTLATPQASTESAGERARVRLRPGVRPAPGALDAALTRMHREGWWLAHLEVGGRPAGEVVTARGLARRARWGARCADGTGRVELPTSGPVEDEPDLEAVFGGWG